VVTSYSTDGDGGDRVSAHRGKWGQLTPWKKMDEKVKSENVQKTAVF